MYAVGKLGSYISRGVYTVSASFHPFGGAVDIIVVEQEDGSFKTSPWYVRFGKFQGVLKTREKVVSINVNGLDADFHMYLDHKGEAYFLKEVDIEEGEAVVAYQSSSGEDTDGQPHDSLPIKSKSCTITPTSKQLASLNLKDGSNIIIFTFSTAMLGKQQVDARVYLWKWNTRVVISGVDGTITKTIYALGWTLESIGHIRVSHICFQALRKMDISLYISARAISQAYLTRQFLLNLTQDGKTLPDGPVVISPDGLFHSLFRKVIRRAPHEFKIACLEDIKALFPSDISPFYAGFGNSDTDEISYLKGEVAMNRRVDTKSYPYLHSLVHDMFPPMSSTATEQGWDFWKLPPPTL